jgi:hypothetical protein
VAATLEPLPRERYRVQLGDGVLELPPALREWKERDKGDDPA